MLGESLGTRPEQMAAPPRPRAAAALKVNTWDDPFSEGSVTENPSLATPFEVELPTDGNPLDASGDLGAGTCRCDPFLPVLTAFDIGLRPRPLRAA